MRRRLLLWGLSLMGLCGAVGAGCRSPKGPAPMQPQAAPAAHPAHPPGAFRDETERAGIRFTYTNGAAGRFYMVETTPGGCAFLDYNRDGWQDLFLVQSGPTPGTALNGPRPPCALYRNRKNGTFEDVTREAGLDRVDQGYAQAVAVGDYDNDGFADIYVGNFGTSRLYHNNGNGTFTDVTEKAGVGDPRLSTSAAWGDYDHDGLLDLVLLHYTPWTPATDVPCSDSHHRHTYCSPEVYGTESFSLYHNQGHGRFLDVSARSGVGQVRGRGLGVLWLDADQDGWSDLYITCDLKPNLLLHNEHGARFEDIGLAAGVAYGPEGAPLAGMGVSAGDYENRGWESLVVTNFSRQPNTLYRAAGPGRFADATYPSGIGAASLNFLAWGIEFLDYDNDGWLDLVVGNGHVDPYIRDKEPSTTYAERKLLLRNQGNGLFRDQVEDLGDLAEERVTRGLAVGDFDNDGRLDILDNAHNMPARLYHNVTPARHFLTLRLEGVHSNHDAAGALVWATTGARRQLAEARDSSSYASSSDRRLHFGLGSATRLDRLEVWWPGGPRQTFRNLPADRFYSLREGGAPVADPGR